MRVYIGFDDTDTLQSDRGTGKLARWFEEAIPAGCSFWGVLRQQLLVDPRIPYTSHNSSACAVVDCEDRSVIADLIQRAVSHIERFSIPGSDPGLCVATDMDSCLAELMRFGLECTSRIVTQADAFKAVNGCHLSGHGGSNDGVIGAAAAVGLTAYGWCGRFIEYGCLRGFPAVTSVRSLSEAGIQVISIDRNAQVPARDDMVDTSGWLRPRLLAGKAVLFVNEREGATEAARGGRAWESIGKKRNSRTKEVK